MMEDFMREDFNPKALMEAYKTNIVNLAVHHHKTCTTGECGISLFLLREMCEKVGMTFTDEEKEIFI